MSTFKTMLLTATIVAGMASTSAFAAGEQPLPAPDTISTNATLGGVLYTGSAIHGAGASSVQNVLVRNFNCLGVNRPLARSSSATASSVISPGNFAGTPSLDCSTEASNAQPNLAGEYVSTGSGFGRQMWRNFTDDFQGGSGSATTGVFNPFDSAGTTRWPNIQYAFSDAPLSASDLSTYNTKAAPSAGPAISFPMFVLPVAIAYSPVYGTNANNQPMVFSPTNTSGIGGTAVLRLTKKVYCGIFNGDIKNWNDKDIQALNGRKMVKINGVSTNVGLPLFDPVNDTEARWTADGAPIRLVGRLDKSGTTDVFTRHLAAVCNPTNGYTGTNKYSKAAETLPYSASGSGNADFSSVRADSNYKPSVLASALAGTTNMVGGEYFNGTAIVRLADDKGGLTAPTSSPTGNLGSGLYLLADGSGRVASAVALAPDYTLNGVKLNGKVTYISADFISPSVDTPAGTGLNAAALQVGTGTLYSVPTVVKAAAALKTILPPQSNADGSFSTIDNPTGTPRKVNNPAGGATIDATRANPLAWADVLYADPANSLAAPTAGYPIVGTTQVMLYTCYKENNRQAVVNLFGSMLGKISKKSDGSALSTQAFGSTNPANFGIDVQSNIGLLPAAWAKAITNTFLTNSTDAGALGLWIQDRLMPIYSATAVVTSAPGVKPITRGPGIKTPSAANAAVCGTKVGA